MSTEIKIGSCKNNYTAKAMKERDSKGWRAVLGCAIAIFWSGALTFGYPGVLSEYWRQTLHSDAGMVMTLLLVSAGIGTFLCGKWHMLLGTRKSYLLGTLIQIIGMFLAIYAMDMAMIWIWAFMTGFASCFIYGPSLATVQNWFPHKRGLVTGIINLVFGCSAAVTAPILNYLLNNYGYVTMNLLITLLILLFNIIGAMLAEMPEKSTLTAEQKNAHQALLIALQNNNSTSAKVLGKEMTPKEAIRTKAFWMMWLTWAFMGAAGISMVSLSKSYSVFLGINGVMALTAFNLTNGFSRIIAGILSDKLDRRVLGCLSFILGSLGYWGLLNVQHSVPLCICTACIGYSLGTLFAISGPLVSDLFGLKYFGMIFGLIFTSYGFIGGLVGPLAAEKMLLFTGSFTPVFIYLAIFCLLGTITIVGAKNNN